MELVTTDWRPNPDFYERGFAGIARGYFRAGSWWLAVGLFAGLTYAFQYVEGWGEALIPPSAVHSLGRVRMAHSSVMIYGFLMNVFLGGLHAVCSPRGGRTAGGRGAAFLGFWILQLALIGGVLAVLHGEAQPVALGELPAWADAGLICGWSFALGSLIVAADVEFDDWIGGVVPWLAAAGVGGILFMAEGAALPYLALPRADAAIWEAFVQSGLLFGMLLPLGFASTIGFMRLRLKYWTWNRVWLALLALIAAIAAPAAGARLYLLEPLRPSLEPLVTGAAMAYAAVIALLGLGFVLALRQAMQEGGEGRAWASRSMIWFGAGWIAIAVCFTQKALLLADREYLEGVRFTDWTAGHQHLFLLGGLGAWAFGVLDELWPELRRSEGWKMPLLADLHLALTLGGVWAMAASLFIAGGIQSSLAEAMTPWSEVMEASGQFWFMRAVAGMAIAVGQILLILNLAATRDRSLPKLREPRTPGARTVELPPLDDEELLR